MSDTLIAALVGGAATLLVSIISVFANICIEKFKNKSKIQQKEYQTKKECLNKVYKELISIINLYPTLSPNDILKDIEYPPNYSMESFDSVLQSLNYRIDDYKEQLNNININSDCKSNIELQISNIEYSKIKICEIRDKYFTAQDKYNSFCASNKSTFDLYAGIKVRNCLVMFDVAIHNVFISGRMAEDKNMPIGNIIQVSQINLINSMRRDLGIH